MRTLDGLENVVLVGGDLTIVVANLNIGHLQNLQKVAEMVLLSGVVYLISDRIYVWKGSLVSVGNRLLVPHAYNSEKFKAGGGTWSFENVYSGDKRFLPTLVPWEEVCT